jgi:arginase family enzyme
VVTGDDLTATFVRAHERLADVLAVGATPLVLGGDALVTVPVLQVLSGKLHGKLGVVAFTAGFDIAPNPLYAPASRWARALELGLVEPDNLALIGGRLDPPGRAAHEVLDELGAHLFVIDDVVASGMASVVEEALEHATAGTEAAYLSVDLGVLETSDPAGLTARELLGGVRAAAGSLLAAADICGAADDAAALVAARAAAEVAAGIAAQRE